MSTLTALYRELAPTITATTRMTRLSSDVHALQRRKVTPHSFRLPNAYEARLLLGSL